MNDISFRPLRHGELFREQQRFCGVVVVRAAARLLIQEHLVAGTSGEEAPEVMIKPQ